MVAKNSLDNRKFLLVTILAAMLCIAGTASAQDLQKSFSTVVMVEGKLGGTSSFGAGIVIGARAGRIYIATANHVVRRGRSGTATDIKVQFHFLPGEKFPAYLLGTRSKPLDLAVLSIKVSADEVPSSQFNYSVQGYSSSLKRGTNVHPLGNPAGQNWGVSIAPEKVDSIKGTEIVFQSSYIQKGHSGGALLDGCGDIVGLIKSDAPPTGKAVRIEVVLDALRQWNYPINLQASVGCAPSTQAQPSEQRNPKVALEKLAATWLAALLYGDVDTFVNLASEPFYFDQKIVLTKRQLRSEYLALQKEKGESWRQLTIDSIKVQTVRELEEQGHDLSSDRIFSNLNLTLDDYAIEVVSGGEGLLLVARPAGESFEIVGMWD